MVPSHASIHRGSLVSIVLKADQGTGRQVTGQVSDLLTRGNHPRGVKVRLLDGRVGRVQSLVMPSDAFNTTGQGQGQGRGYSSGGGGGGGYGQVPAPYTGGYDPRPPQQDSSSWSAQTQTGYGGQDGFRGHGNEGERFIDPSERSEQVEYLQSYEDARPPTQEERDRATLQRDFPSLDGSLVAAIYTDNEGNLSACRELLQAIGADP
ncbi:protein of unknown function [Taphrina deformans PYCC 5710]|uniref:Uncharacterized protein n=1 Tax=Taphrina deformans (strain PYCC 5710 / ATCC 11124 / CBS 356.35 / IMI 108563 / JCM 9778 / NBRC 8474) TaxID=1097556 RepID=R4XEJ5_TAPDE|nr:protein of unknown function [Taphrina deformans PYCC 5710]|eukprot:CCG82896.1 protein of unknown function [Taphrina deformans PYCC 5710]